MLFPAADKRPLEFDQKFDAELLMGFVNEHGSTVKPKAGAEEDKAEL